MTKKEINEIAYKIYKVGNPILKFKIDSEIFNKEVDLEKYISLDNISIKYWLDIYNGYEIHGSKDSTFENVMVKLLEYGFGKENSKLKEMFEQFLNDDVWNNDLSFHTELYRVVLYPFYIRAGYLNNKYINDFFRRRLNMIEKTIDKYGYDFEMKTNKPTKYNDEFVFKFDGKTEALPTIYDLYAFSFYQDEDDLIKQSIEKIVEYLLDERFQSIPQKAYLYDKDVKRLYAVGNVYHACMTETRKLFFLYLLSFFNSAKAHFLFKCEIDKLLLTINEEGLYEFDKELIKEKKNSNHMYSGSHMGLNENRRSKSWLKVESSFWMIKILHNIQNL